MYRLSIAMLWLFICATGASPCFAGVLYSFNGSITPYPFVPQGATETFTYQALNFITADTVVPPSALSSCSVSYPNAASYSPPPFCQSIEFLPSSPGFGVPGAVLQISFDDGVANPDFYFSLGSFDTYGTHITFPFVGANTAALSVTPAGAIPEPATIGLFLTGLVGLGWWQRRTQKQTA